MKQIDYSTRQLNRLRRRILRVYDQARREMTDQLSEFLERFEQLDAHKRELLAAGKLTEEQYRTWLRNQVFQSELMQAKLDNITQTCTNAQQTAYKLARDEQYDIFAFGANCTFYELEQAAGVEFNLTLYNTEAVKRLLLENPKLVPNRRIKSESNRTYDARIFNRYVMQGIIQGKTVRAIAERAVQGMADTEVHWAMNNAITALTGAQNAGALQQMRNAKKLGIEVQKRWNSTLDYRTREMHRLLDQETAELDEPFEVEGYEIMYPGDPDADPEMVYHCRCKLTSALVKYPRRNAMRRDNTTVEVVPVQSYEEWYEGKKAKSENSLDFGIGTNKTNLEYINSDQYRAKFNSISDNPILNQAIYKYCKAAVIHQSGDYYEDLTILRIDGSFVGQSTGKERNTTHYPKFLKNDVYAAAPYSLVSIHNHGTNVPPSGADFCSAGEKRYAFGIVACHDGKVYYYSSAHARPFTTSLIDETVDKYSSPEYNLNRVQAAEKALNSVRDAYGIEWRELL